MKTNWCCALVLFLLSAAAAPSRADEVDELRKLRDTTIALVNALVEQGVLTRQKADQLIAQAEQAGAKGASTAGGTAPPASGVPSSATAATGTPATGTAGVAGTAGAPVAPGVVRVPYIPEAVKQDISNEVRQEVLAQAKSERWGEPGALPDWLNHFTWYGDIRFRAEADRFPTDNSPNAPVATLQAFGVNINNSTEADNRLRVRARFGFDATVGDTVTVGMRLATGGVGAGSNPGTENQTLGNYETRSTVGFDRAYLAYTPEPWVTLSLGRVGNPFFAPTTLIWAEAVSLEGVVVGFRPKITSDLTFFTTAGALPILQIDPIPTNNATSKWLYAYQSGFELKFDDTAMLKTGVALYDYRHVEGTPNPTIYSTAFSDSAAPFRQTGNTVFDINGLLNTQNGTQNYLWGLASKFHELNVSAELDLGFVGPTHVIIDGDWVKNLGFDESEIERRTGFQVDKQIRGWQTRLAVGYPDMHQKYAWQGYVGYRWVQRDATVDAFTDQDFHLGGTDAEGYYLGGKFAFEKNSYIDLRWFSAKQIDGVQLAGADGALSGLPLAIDVFQLDINSSF
jgi:Putative porin